MTNASPTYHPQSGETVSQIEALTILVEASQTDIAPTYSEWLALGFALADALGDAGASYFHRLSRFYPQYDDKKAQKQYEISQNTEAKKTYFLETIISLS